MTDHVYAVTQAFHDLADAFTTMAQAADRCGLALAAVLSANLQRLTPLGRVAYRVLGLVGWGKLDALGWLEEQGFPFVYPFTEEGEL